MLWHWSSAQLCAVMFFWNQSSSLCWIQWFCSEVNVISVKLNDGELTSGFAVSAASSPACFRMFQRLWGPWSDDEEREQAEFCAPGGVFCHSSFAMLYWLYPQKSNTGDLNHKQLHGKTTYNILQHSVCKHIRYIHYRCADACMIMHACMYRRPLHYTRLHYITLPCIYTHLCMKHSTVRWLFPAKFYHARNVFKKNVRACDFNESLMRLRDRSYFALEFLCKKAIWSWKVHGSVNFLYNT